MFICGFISFTVWPSFTGRIISLSRSHIPPLRPPALALCLSAPRQAIKILSATLLKNYGSPFRSPAPLSSVLVKLSLRLDRLARADRPRTRCLSFSPSHYRLSISSGSCLASSHRSLLVAPLHPPLDSSSGSTLRCSPLYLASVSFFRFSCVSC